MDEEIVRVVAVTEDITEAFESAERLKKTEKRAREAEKLASIATLTAGLAHDVGTPIHIIMGYAELMEKSLTDENERKRARLIGEQTKRVTDLIQTLLNISRPHEPNLIRMSLAETLEHGLQFYREKLKAHGIKVERHFSEVAPVLGDPDQLEQVFLNLFVNAADAMNSGGTLQVYLRAPDEESVEVIVRDSGAGIEVEHLKKIFEPFFTTKSRGKGNGLGLLVSKRIIVEHEGSIDVESALGEGTEFRIMLPSAPEG